MPNNSKSKLKTLCILRMLEEETDEDHGLTLRQIIERLADADISAERKAVYRDLQTLRDFGVDIRTYQRNPVEYAIAKRDFSLDELMLLVDAVESCKALTRRQVNLLTTNLKLLASDKQRALLDKRIHVDGRVKSKTESVLGNVNTIHDAIRRHMKVQFHYFKHGIDGNRYRTNDGSPHAVTPVGITYSDGFYYMTGWDEAHGDMCEYRVDRMEKLKVSKEKAVKNEQISRYVFDGDEYMCFGRFNGRPVTATLVVDSDKMDIIFDKFGDGAQVISHNDKNAHVHVKVHVSQQFFGWIAGLGGTVRISAPKTLKQEYEDFLRGLIDGL